MQATNNSPEAIVATINATPAPATVEAKPAKAKRQPKAAKPSKPAAPAADETRARCIANRAHVQPYYGGPSLVSHATRAPKLRDALDRIASPIQRAKSATERDASALVLLAKHSDKAGTFCPVAATADLGALSRLASLKLIAPHSDTRAKLTKAGRDLAALTARKAG